MYGRCRHVTGGTEDNIDIAGNKKMGRCSCGEYDNEERGAVKMEKKDGVN